MTTDDGIDISVRGTPAITASQAAKARGITAAGMRAVLSQNGIKAIAMLDDRTALYDKKDIARLPAPGRGTHRKRAASDRIDPDLARRLTEPIPVGQDFGPVPQPPAPARRRKAS